MKLGILLILLLFICVLCALLIYLRKRGIMYGGKPGKFFQEIIKPSNYTNDITYVPGVNPDKHFKHLISRICKPGNKGNYKYIINPTFLYHDNGDKDTSSFSPDGIIEGENNILILEFDEDLTFHSNSTPRYLKKWREYNYILTRNTTGKNINLLRIAYGNDQQSIEFSNQFNYDTEKDISEIENINTSELYKPVKSLISERYTKFGEHSWNTNRIYFNDFSGGIDIFVISTVLSILNTKYINGNIILARFLQPPPSTQNEIFTMKVIPQKDIVETKTGKDYFSLIHSNKKYDRADYGFVIEVAPKITHGEIFNKIRDYIYFMCSTIINKKAILAFDDYCKKHHITNKEPIILGKGQFNVVIEVPDDKSKVMRINMRDEPTRNYTEGTYEYLQKIDQDIFVKPLEVVNLPYVQYCILPKLQPINPSTFDKSKLNILLTKAQDFLLKHPQYAYCDAKFANIMQQGDNYVIVDNDISVMRDSTVERTFKTKINESIVDEYLKKGICERWFEDALEGFTYNLAGSYAMKDPSFPKTRTTLSLMMLEYFKQIPSEAYVANKNFPINESIRDAMIDAVKSRM